jgi:hypothetical protein
MQSMSTVMGQMKRIRGWMAAVALAVAMGLTGAAPAQFGEAAGFSQMMAPYFLRRDLQLFVDSLDLDDGQAVIVESLYWDYEDANEESKQRMIQSLRDMREELETLDRDRILQLVMAPFEDRMEEWDDLNDQFLESVRAVLNAEQLERWPAFMRELHREKELPNGQFSGERLNLFHILRQLDIEERVMTAVSPVMEQYAVALDQALQRRLRLVAESREIMMNSMRDNRSNEALRTYEQIIESRLDVRNVNDQFIETIAEALPAEYGAKFRQEALERAYPRVFRPTQAQRIFKAASEIEGLSEEVVEAIRTLEQAFLNELDLMNMKLVGLVHEQEPADEYHRAQVFASRGSGERPKRPENELRAGFREREELERRYIKQLQSLLTPEQFRSLPGARRFLQQTERMSRPHEALGAATSPKMQKESEREKRQRQRLGASAPPPAGAGGGGGGPGPGASGSGGGGGGGGGPKK